MGTPTDVSTEYFRESSISQLCAFFQAKGPKALKEEDRQEIWYQDWIDYQAKHGLYASLLSAQQYSKQGHQFSIFRLTRFLEVCAYLSPAHAYSLHVSFLGLFPIYMSSNESLKREAVARLEKGGLFAFGVSEKAHGSDLFANEFALLPAGSGSWRADGSKYYIGNANAACLISILGKQSNRTSTSVSKKSPFVFIALRPQETTSFQNVEKIHTLGIRSAFVGQFEVKNHILPEVDIISSGREAWDAVFGTVNFGKFFLGFGAIGICEHAFAEAYTHLHGRVLYDKPVSQMPHIQKTITSAYARLVAMKFYAYRALDYLQVSSANDRRYLLFNAVQKAKVSTEGVKVTELLSECIGARGVEAETYFESALRDAQLIPGLEGSTHINFGLTAQFLDNYFSESAGQILSPSSLMLGEAASNENEYWMVARDRHAKTVGFANYLTAYEPIKPVANVSLFMEQVTAFRQFVLCGTKEPSSSTEAHVFIAIGKCLSTCVYGQLVAENCVLAEATQTLINIIFNDLIEDLSVETLKLSALFPPESIQRQLLKQVICVPTTTATDVASVSAFIGSRYST